MITKEQYLDAQNIVELYEEQLRQIEINRIDLLREEQLKRESECGDHYYIGFNYGKRQCQDCGNIIE